MSDSEHFWKLSCGLWRKAAAHFGESISVSKHVMFGPLLEVELWKKCTPLWCEAHFEVSKHTQDLGPQGLGTQTQRTQRVTWTRLDLDLDQTQTQSPICYLSRPRLSRLQTLDSGLQTLDSRLLDSRPSLAEPSHRLRSYALWPYGPMPQAIGPGHRPQAIGHRLRRLHRDVDM